MNSENDVLNDRASPARQRFVDQGAAQHLKLVTAQNELHAGSTVENCRAQIAGIRAIAHNLAGMGATFGRSDIGGAAAALEQVCAAVEADPAFEPADVRGRIETELDALNRMLATLSVDDAEADKFNGDTPATAVSSNAKSVLLIDDDDLLAAHLRTGLDGFGYALTAVNHLSAVPAALAECEPVAIILDLEFDGDRTAGPDALGRIRTTDGIGCPIVALSAHGDFDARLAAVRAGCDAYLNKPVLIPDLVDTLDQLTSDDIADPPRILIIDDDPLICQYVAAILTKAGMTTVELQDPTRTLNRMAEFSPELLIVDLWMKECSGKELASVIRQQPQFGSIPIVFLSGEDDKDVQLDAMGEGGDDFLSKPIVAKHLLASVALRVQRFRALRDTMIRDSMTGLYNHTTTKQMLENELERAQRSNADLCFAMLDIDHFKAVNDTHGHAVGDVVIKGLARILKQRLRRIDVIGRLGGEEFGVILPNTPVAQATVVMESIRQTFADTVNQAEKSTFNSTLSCGIAVFPGHDSGEALSEAADQALYEAKQGGRNRVVIAPSVN